MRLDLTAAGRLLRHREQISGLDAAPAISRNTSCERTGGTAGKATVANRRSAGSGHAARARTKKCSGCAVLPRRDLKLSEVWPMCTDVAPLRNA